jgi:hypothetical protein
MSPNSLFQPFHHQNAHFFFSKLKNALILIIFEKGVEIEKMHFYNKMFEIH